MEKKQRLVLTSVAVFMIIILLTKTMYSNTESRTIIVALQDDIDARTARVALMTTSTATVVTMKSTITPTATETVIESLNPTAGTSTADSIALQKSLATSDRPGTATSLELTATKQNRPVVRVRYALALSYFDQISHAAGRVQSHQCWAKKMGGVKIVEPFVVDTSYLGGLSSDMDASHATRLSDLFDLEHWNRRSVESSLPPLISWEEFLQTATRQVILVRNNWRQLFRNEPFSCGKQDLEKLRTFWTQFLEPHGFQIFRELCVDLKKRSELTKVIVDQNSDINVTVIIDDWREMIGVRGPSLPYLVTDSNCEKSFGGQTVLNWMKPSRKVMNDTDLYISKYLNTDHKYISVMIRWETVLWRKHMNGNQCMAKILESVKRMQQEKNTTLIFMATDAGNLGSDIMARTTRYSMVDPKYRRESVEHTKKILQTIFDPPMSLAEYEQQFQGLQSKNAANISNVQKLVAAKAECLLRIPAEGDFQKHALELYESFHTETKCTEEIRSC